MYEIWAVRPLADNTTYAMKWLPKGSKYTREHINGLKHEFTVGRTLDHRACIKTYDFGTRRTARTCCWSCSRRPTSSSRSSPAATRSCIHRAKEILTECAAGLAHVHEKGWVHRDIKPDNFLVDDDNIVQLIDFNLTQKPAGALGKLFGIKTPVQGTHSYMAPEQIRGQALDARADIYSFGCMVYEFFAGKLPFTANTPRRTAATSTSQREPPTLTVFDKNVTPEFADVRPLA